MFKKITIGGYETLRLLGRWFELCFRFACPGKQKLDAGLCAHFSWTIDSRDPIGSKIIYLETYRAPYEAL